MARRFILRGALFSSPFILYFVFILLIDPFNYFNVSKIVSDKRRENYALPLNSSLWKLIQFKRTPMKNVLIGDSRMGLVDERELKSYTGEDYFNATIGGGNLKEIIQTFWYFTSISKLENVYISISIETYSKSNIRNRVDDDVSVLKNPLLYLVNYEVMESAFYIVSSCLSSKDTSIGIPQMSKKEFWNYQLNDAAARYYSNYIYPSNYFEGLKAVAEYCRKNEIKLTFIIFPTHTDLQNVLSTYNLVPMNERLLADIKSIGTVYDMNFPNNITSNYEDFSDPFHLHQEIFSKTYLSRIWGSQIAPADSFSRVYRKF
jgi:hypothetical protein